MFPRRVAISTTRYRRSYRTTISYFNTLTPIHLAPVRRRRTGNAGPLGAWRGTEKQLEKPLRGHLRSNSATYSAGISSGQLSSNQRSLLERRNSGECFRAASLNSQVPRVAHPYGSPCDCNLVLFVQYSPSLLFSIDGLQMLDDSNLDSGNFFTMFRHAL